MTTTGAQLDDLPDNDDLFAWLSASYTLPVTRANAWALWLEGLPWRYIRPLVRIVVNTGQVHPKAALEEASRLSSDRAFKSAAKAHLTLRRSPSPAAKRPTS